MYVGAVSSSYNPHDVAAVAGLRIRAEREQTESSSQKTAPPAQHERVVHGEVLSRQKLQSTDIASTNDALANRQFNQQQSGLSYNSKQAVNTYITNQFRGDAIDQSKNEGTDSLINVYV